ncbi:hypothetical protein HPB49_006699 [Dermacentor silvarum]|uniref:Uncharacterized protein n=1 Tax=Dermacentor silvarum TaxID=543639 RepID=A0ACB8DWP2_DERSI|nr:hypothetical protein HPB49_006699 [Dermacentor silvarum]
MKAGAYTILKRVVVRPTITYVVHANGRLLRQSFDVEIRSLQDLEALLQIVHNKQFCLGCSRSDVATIRAAVKVGSTLFPKDCSVLTDANKGVCNMCINLNKSLKKNTSTPARRKVPIAACVLRKRLIRATAARERKKREVKQLSEKLRDTFTTSLDKLVQDLP